MPTTLSDRYELHELVGSGAAGRVYRARDLRLGRDVAVKRLRADALGGSETRARFAREATALARVSDPHVLAVFDVSTEAEDSYLVTDFCPDGSLADRIGQGPLTSAEVRAVAHDVGAGLVAIHGSGIVHRDIKPSNILRLGGRWVIGDLGIARVEGDASLTQTGAVIGTPDYWAPETARGAVPTQAVDIYGLGCVLFEALSGRPPFRGDSPLETGLLHATAAAPPLPNTIEREDPALAWLVRRMLAKDPAKRPTAAALDRALATGRGGEPGDTRRYPEAATSAMTVPALPRTVAYPAAPAPRRSRVSRRALLALGGILLAAALGALALSRLDTSVGSGTATRPTGGTTVDAPPPSTRSIATTPVARSVPRLEGRSVASATAALTQRGLELAIAGTVASSAPRGSITAQAPAASARVSSGSTVRVTLSDGPPPTTTVPTTTVPRESPGKGPAKPKPGRSHGHGRDKPGHGHDTSA